MWRTRSDARAVFHDRAAMEEAVHTLERDGVRHRRIFVSRVDASTGTPREAPEAGPALAVGGVIGAAIGAALALFSDPALVQSSPVLAVLARVIATAATGAISGAIVVLIATGLRGPSGALPAGDYLVRVKTRGPAAADDVRERLARAGGDVLPSTGVSDGAGTITRERA